ncbi:hypothetical protein FRC00_006997 [Tulasnella sp. 408]|nr:hypothetical protein FRC00_006997 [Tulasnella sp. 408]
MAKLGATFGKPNSPIIPLPSTLIPLPLLACPSSTRHALLKAGEEREAPATVRMNVDDSAAGKDKTPFCHGQTRRDLRQA